MVQGGISIYNINGGGEYPDWEWCAPYVYSGEWKRSLPWVYNGSKWQQIGGAGANMQYWLDKNGNIITDSHGNPILIRDVWLYLIDSDGKNVLDSNGKPILVKAGQ